MKLRKDAKKRIKSFYGLCVVRNKLCYFLFSIFIFLCIIIIIIILVFLFVYCLLHFSLLLPHIMVNKDYHYRPRLCFSICYAWTHIVSATVKGRRTFIWVKQRSRVNDLLGQKIIDLDGNPLSAL